MLEIKKVESSNPNQFIIKSDEPITLEFIQSEKGQIIVFAYKGTTVESDAEPIGMYDSDAEPKSWVL